jgi:hypothetical protein
MKELKAISTWFLILLQRRVSSRGQLVGRWDLSWLCGDCLGDQEIDRKRFWRRGSESNRRIKVLQTSPLPLGYRASGNYVKPPAEN